MGKAIKAVAKIALCVGIIFLTYWLLEQSGLVDSASKAYDKFASEWNFPSVSSIQSSVSDQLNKLQSSIQGNIAETTSSENKSTKTTKNTNTPKTQNKVKKVAVSSAASSSSKTASLSEYKYTSLRLYEYGYSLLSSKEKACYNLIKDTVDDCNTANITLPYALSSSEASKVLNYYLNDHPEVFYIKKTVSDSNSDSVSVDLGVLYYMNTSTNKVVQMSFEYTDSALKIDKQKKQLEQNVKSILSNINDSMSDEEKLKVIYDTSKQLWFYSYSALSSPAGNLSAYESFGALVKKSAVCSGYAKALKILLDTAELDSLVVTGDAYSGKKWGGHAWNAVTVDGNWRYIDATFDDTSDSNDKYLYESVSEFLKDHRPYACSSSDYGSNYATMPLETA